MRPGCDRPAAARLAFDPVALQLWLDPLGNRAAPVQELCEFHVERLTIPRGWSATDRRPGTVVAAIAVATAPAPQPVAIEPEPEPEPEPEVEPEPAPSRSRRPARPRPAAAAPDSPLLARAFAWTGPQQSILTQGRPDDTTDED